MKLVCIGLFVVIVAFYTGFLVSELRFRVLAKRELSERGLRRVRGGSSSSMCIDPGPGYRLIDICYCEREGKEYFVIIMNKGWFNKNLTVDAELIDDEDSDAIQVVDLCGDEA